jgi:hypothetical protein
MFVVTVLSRAVQEEKRLIDRRRNLLTLIARHLMDSGYVESATTLQAESSISLTKLDVADNMDLLYILGVSGRRAVDVCCDGERLC